MKEMLKQQIENGEYDNLFLLLENEELHIRCYDNNKIKIETPQNKSNSPDSTIEITLDTLIDIIKQKDVLSFISGYSVKQTFKKIFEKYITEDLLKSYIDIFWG